MNTSKNLSYVNTKLKQNQNTKKTPSTLVDNTTIQGIGAKVKGALSGEFNSIIFGTLVVLLIILVIVLYRYTFQRSNKEILQETIYHKKIDLQPLPPCSQLEPQFQHRLCDYYIASSFNTFSIGQQHFDYVSNDMLKRVLLSGARYIQFPICSSHMGLDAEPVIGTAEKGKNAITSFNTVSIREALVIIRDFAFKKVRNNRDPEFANASDDINYDALNYPLIIHLQIHTHSVDVLNQFYKSVTEILGDYLLNNENYQNYPIGLEKLCHLLNKIIIISTSGYENSLLDNIVIPNNHLFQTKTKNDFDNKELLVQKQNEYYKSLSFQSQKKHKGDIENINLKIKELLTQDINSDNNNNQGLLNEKNLLPNVEEKERLTLFNMVGLTLVEPMDTNEVDSINYNPLDPFTYGCQLVAMNYQTPDKYMNMMIDVFKESSFVLKPSGLRLPSTQDEMQDFLDQFKLKKSKKINYIPDFLYRYNNQIITLQETTSLRNKYISLVGNGFKVSSIDEDSLGVNDMFMIKKSPLSDANNYAIMLVHPKDNNKVITVSPNFKTEVNNVSLSVRANDARLIQYQSFYPEIGLSQSDEDTLNEVEKISFRLALDNESGKVENKIFYLGVVNNHLQILSENENESMVSLQYKKMDVDTRSLIKSPTFGTLTVFDSENGILGMTKNLKKDKITRFNIKPYTGNLLGKKNNNGNFSEVVTIQEITKSRNNKKVKSGKYSGKYLGSYLGNMEMKDEVIRKENIFIIAKENNEDDQVVITDFEGKYLISNDDGTLKFVFDKSTSDTINSNQRRYLVNRMLGLEKYFIIQKDIII
jgi:hypothetical protein